jgi:hypothetical protein
MNNMRKVLFIIYAGILMGISSVAQDKGNASTNSPGNKEDKKGQGNITIPEKEKFIDLNGNGINDKEEIKGKQKGKNRDKFVDKDGDGINDNRCDGLGWGNKGKKNQYGKRGR